MGVAFDDAPDRPEHIDAILNGLDRYNPETTQIFQEYVVSQCEERTVDMYANLALLKLYVPNHSAQNTSKSKIVNVMIVFKTFPIT